MTAAVARQTPLRDDAVFDAKLAPPIKLAEDGLANTSDDTIIERVRENIRRPLPQCAAYGKNPNIALLVCGGPSLKDTEKELAEAWWGGGKVIAVNGAYQWCIDHNIMPSAAIMLDSREFNSRFFETPIKGCKYLLASQCHPKTFDICEGREVYIWHAIGSGLDKEVEMLRDYYFGQFHPVTLGTTVGVRAISLLRMLGFPMIDIWGLDSCWLAGNNHAYPQPENDNDQIVPVWLNPDPNDSSKAIRFVCSPWHIKQMETFKELLKERGDLFQLSVRGDGLIATMMRTGAELQTELERNGE